MPSMQKENWYQNEAIKNHHSQSMTSMESLFSGFLQPKGMRVHQQSEIFSDLYYDERIMPAVQAKVDSLGKQLT
ncbi:hypothetical protein POSPLADRAFT_1056252 [Postia placenta MAD-698-R-SB12]|uniref:Uncharacterized protein n=1 Tax=Postia placenta MAD-698-R-SB12 TaxID=670580 RepID=A0A1X6N2R6_9APHY|nr:hypothetical protein POSPLADRAFT_1056252 [Postia placenta MAD-698-R-SB12]OSX62884.1 hypothetical protein POSPLADRAFT_1056252 [Postia placenta MAD-698-R-SB12]